MRKGGQRERRKKGGKRNFYLICLICAREKREEASDFKHHTTSPPKVHLWSVVTVCQETFGRSVPSSADILCVRLLRIDSATRSKVCKLKTAANVCERFDENILRLNISVEYSLGIK